MVPDLNEEKNALIDLYEGIGVCTAAESTAVFISLGTAETAIRCIEYYIQQMTN